MEREGRRGPKGRAVCTVTEKKRGSYAVRPLKTSFPLAADFQQFSV